jgi:hypothetical protein
MCGHSVLSARSHAVACVWVFRAEGLPGYIQMKAQMICQVNLAAGSSWLRPLMELGGESHSQARGHFTTWGVQAHLQMTCTLICKLQAA